MTLIEKLLLTWAIVFTAAAAFAAADGLYPLGSLMDIVCKAGNRFVCASAVAGAAILFALIWSA